MSIFLKGHQNIFAHYELAPSVKTGDALSWLLETDQGTWIRRDTILKFYKAISTGVVDTFLRDELDDAANWTGTWAVTGEKYHSAETCMTDSPSGKYQPNQDAVCELTQPVAIPANARSARLHFYARWDIEAYWDYAQVSVRTDAGDSWALCGLFTDIGSNVQPDEPLYDGEQTAWVAESMSLDEFIGQNIHIEFHMVSGNSFEKDGFYFDDLHIEFVLPVTGVQTIDLHDFNLAQNQPNPTDGTTYIEWSGKEKALGGHVKLLVFNALGETVFEKAIDPGMESGIWLDTKPLRPGVYTYQLMGDAGRSEVIKMAVVR